MDICMGDCLKELISNKSPGFCFLPIQDIQQVEVCTSIYQVLTILICFCNNPNKTNFLLRLWNHHSANRNISNKQQPLRVKVIHSIDTFEPRYHRTKFHNFKSKPFILKSDFDLEAIKCFKISLITCSKTRFILENQRNLTHRVQSVQSKKMKIWHQMCQEFH